MEIKLTGKRGAGLSTIVDQDIHDQYGHLKWHLNDSGYAVRRTNGVTHRLHRIVAQTPDGMVTDHKNHDRLDNRRCNLRVVSHRENMENVKGEKGYTWDASKQKYMVRYRRKFYGRYATESEAEKAYQLAKSGVAYQGNKRVHPNRPVNIFRNKSNKGWQTRYTDATTGQRIYLGTFPTLEQAQLALTRKRG